MAERDRPLSPHLQIWRWQLHMALSILHRTTGMINSLGTILLVWWLIAIASGPAAFGQIDAVLSHWLGRLVLFGLTLSLTFHLCSGLRHLVMDSGQALELKANRQAGILVIVGAVVLTLVVWIAAYMAAGGI